jgi:hypothetical protein
MPSDVEPCTGNGGLRQNPPRLTARKLFFPSKKQKTKKGDRMASGHEESSTVRSPGAGGKYEGSVRRQFQLLSPQQSSFETPVVRKQ